MEDFDLTAAYTWKPLAWLGIKHPFFTIDGTIVIQTWIVLAIILGTIFIFRYFLKFKKSLPYFLITQFVRSFMDLTSQTLGGFHYNHFVFITSLFLFILSCNSAPAIPWLEEPTRDLNTTLALGIISFFYTQWYTVKAHGFGAYLKSFLAPIFVMLPLNIIGKLSNIISISFRLFGNIFGGSTIGAKYSEMIEGSVIWETLGLFSGLNFVILFFFGLFEGLLQAFVFAMLSLTYLSIALQKEEPVVKEAKR